MIMDPYLLLKMSAMLEKQKNGQNEGDYFRLEQTEDLRFKNAEGERDDGAFWWGGQSVNSSRLSYMAWTPVFTC